MWGFGLRGSVRDRGSGPARRAVAGISAVAAAILVFASAPPSALAASTAGCDPLDSSLCLLPWPNDFFTQPDPSAPTGLRVDISPLATPANGAGVPIDPTDWNRLDGFSPGSPIVTHVPGMDNPQAFAKTDPPTNTDIARSLEGDSPIVVLDATTGVRWPVWAELDRALDLNGNPPPPDRTGLLIHPAVNFTEGHRYIVALRNLRDAQGHVLAPQPAFVDLVSPGGAPGRCARGSGDPGRSACRAGAR